MVLTKARPTPTNFSPGELPVIIPLLKTLEKGKEAAMAPSKPNLLFIMTDHQRADSLGMRQAGIDVTPNLNRLAEDGTNFSRAYNTCPLCVPARTALATGKYPTKNGVVTNDWKGETAGDHTTLHELLHRAGYRVGHIGVHHIRVAPPIDERVEFDRWETGEGYAEYLDASGVSHPPGDIYDFKKEIAENQAGERTMQYYSNTETATWPGDAGNFKDLYWCRQAAEFLRKQDDRPFALFLYLWAPHPPLWVPEPYASLFAPDEIELPPNVGCPAEGEPAAYRRGVPAQLADGVSIEQWRRVWAAHLGLVHMADHGIGSVLDTLQETGNRENTLVLFTVDHGEHLGQHRMYQKMEMYEQAIRVPLVLAGPGIGSGAVDVPVSHLDIMPSLLDLFDLETPDDLDGLSLTDTLCKGTAPPARPVFSLYSGNPVRGDTRRCVITERFKYVWVPGDGRELYDLEADPLEMENLAVSPAHRDLVQRLHAQCRRWGEEHSDPVFGE